MSGLLHPSHCHLLYRRELSEHCSRALSCGLCRNYISGPISVYGCEECRFHLHKFCADLPPRIRHPSHPDHPLDLRVGEQGDHGHTPVLFQCDSCSFDLDADIAMATLRVEVYYGPNLQVAKAGADDNPASLRFSHEHPLTSFHAKTESHDILFCIGCQKRISEEGSGCQECGLFLHKACADPPLKIHHHPLHPHHHPLRLVCNSSEKMTCEVCRLRFYVGYHCEECEFHLDLGCAIWTMSCEDDEREEGIMSRSARLDHFAHPHQLSSFRASKRIEVYCKICHEAVSGGFFGCVDCSFFLHESCARPPAQIQHPLHPEHALALAPFPQLEKEIEVLECACRSSEVKDLYSYACRMCDFYMDQVCAFRTVPYLEEGVSAMVQHPLHEHELKLHYASSWKLCTGCLRVFCGIAYRCTSKGCEFCLHKSCEQLPSDLVHPSHSRHPLTLRRRPLQESIDCSICRKEIWGRFTFSCGECEFHLDVPCAQIPTPKHPFHEHNLMYFKCAEGKLECNACRESCNVDLYCCVPCNFNLHHHCSQLPPTLKSSHHVDQLALYESFAKDVSGEYSCNICEQRIDPNKWVYCCEICQLVAHVECAISPASR